MGAQERKIYNGSLEIYANYLKFKTKFMHTCSILFQRNERKNNVIKHGIIYLKIYKGQSETLYCATY